ncbi:MAG: hypothetical protein ACI35V_01340 [Sphingobacterium composti]|uniref:hypothetical protein n=1 Tax=Sphingobacterium composti TaxID=363260 RepID=UPI001359E4CC|nr:hypothetical protein [Sphingobacterium composti Ten et al. 2007 non Yoo et al. 2007]
MKKKEHIEKISCKDKKKKLYATPSVLLASYVLESSISATSVIQMSFENDGETPVIEDWVQRENQQFWDF